jgi:hypothetical protein
VSIQGVSLVNNYRPLFEEDQRGLRRRRAGPHAEGGRRARRAALVTAWAIRAARRSFAAAALVGGLTAAVASGGAQPGERHAGTVLAVDVQARTLTVDEYRANGARGALRVQVPRNVPVFLSERNAAGHDAASAFWQHPITLADIRTGDFVVIELSEPPDAAVARLVMVTLRKGDGS